MLSEPIYSIHLVKTIIYILILLLGFRGPGELPLPEHNNSSRTRLRENKLQRFWRKRGRLGNINIYLIIKYKYSIMCMFNNLICCEYSL
jgi:hypothetical protein